MRYYKIILGDSRHMEEVQSNSVDFIVTSPPYASLDVFSKEGDVGAEFDLSRYHSLRTFFSEIAKTWKECLLPNEKIVCIDGIKEIKDVTTSDLVLTHNGRFMTVTGVIKHYYNGHVIRIKVGKFNETITLTENHKILTLDGWKEAKDLSTYDILLYPVPKETEYYLSVTTENDWLELVSYYIAEGRDEPYAIEFCLGLHEELLSKRIKELCGIYFNEELKSGKMKDVKKISEYFYEERNGRYIHVGSKVLADTFRKAFGHGARNKKLLPETLFLTKEKQKVILDAFSITDGNIETTWISKKGKVSERHSYSTSSETLKEQIKLLLLRQGIVPSMTLYKGNYNIRETRRKPVNGYAQLNIKTLERLDYDGNVYNLEVDEDESYTTTACVVHNCERVLRPGGVLICEWEDYPVGSRFYGYPREICLAGPMIESIEKSGLALISRWFVRKFEPGVAVEKFAYTMYSNLKSAMPRAIANVAYAFAFYKREYKQSQRKLDFKREEWANWSDGIWNISFMGTGLDISGGATFPVEFAKRCIKIYTNPGDVVLEPFLGTGTTMKASFELGRSCIGFEVLERMLPTIKAKVQYGTQDIYEPIMWQTVNRYEVKKDGNG